METDMTDFNGMSTQLVLFNAKRLANHIHIHCTNINYFIINLSDP